MGTVGMKIGRRDFVKVSALGGAGLLLQPAPYAFNWLRDVPPSLMLHSGNLEYLPDLIPVLKQDFSPMTYRGWMDRLARFERLVRWFAQVFDLRPSQVAQAIAVRPVSKLPLILSIDDVGTDWIRYEHRAMFQELAKAGLPAVIGIQPKATPQQESRTWGLLAELHQAGWEIASHTINHPPLTKVSRRTANYEISESFDRIEKALGERPITLIAPFGDSAPAASPEPGNRQLYEIAQAASVRVIAGILDGRRRPSAAKRRELRSDFDGADIPEYVGRIAPNPDPEITRANLHLFKSGGYRQATADE